MKKQGKTILFICYVSMTIFVQCSYAFSAGLSKLLHRKIEPIDENTQVWSDGERSAVHPAAEKRGCDGFPCMYSHLGSKAGRAALDRTLARFIADCFNDGSCSPVSRRRKRNEQQEVRLQDLRDFLFHVPVKRLDSR